MILRIQGFIVWLALVSGTALAQQLPVPSLKLPEPSNTVQTPPQGEPQPAPVTAPPANMPQLKLSARLEQEKIYQDEVFDYLIELSWEKTKETCELEFKLPLIPGGEKLKAVGSEFESENYAKPEKESVKRIYRFKYVPEEQGGLSISQADFEYRCRGTQQWFKISAPPFPLQVGKKRIHLAEVVGTLYFRLSLLAILLIAVGFSVAMVLRARKKRKAEQDALPVEKTAEEKALEVLKNADQYRIAGRYPDYFLGLEQALRRYLEEKYSIRWSARERLVEEVSRATAAELASELDFFLKFSDRVKFAGYEPKSAEMDRCYQAVRRVIEFKKMEIVGGNK